MANPHTIVVSAMLGAVPGQGGWAWAVLQYLLGLKQLGHRVLFIEPISPENVRPHGAPLAASEAAAHLHRVLQPYGLADSSSLMRRGTRETAGMSYDAVIAAVERADVLLNLSGQLVDGEVARRIPIRVYLDLDPAFTQLWQVVHGIDMHLAGHTHYLTVGLSLGRPDCPIPTCGVSWLTTYPPVVLKHWPQAERVTHAGLTTIANWRGYGSAEYRGVCYGQKAHSLRQFIELPQRCREHFLLALGIHPDEKVDLAALTGNGWTLLDPAVVADTPQSYQAFIQGSKAEFGIAKSGYVLARCGWFSDRSVCYLASGRPVIAHETGFSRFLPTGQGLFAFTNMDDVARAVDDMNSDYPRHADAARRLAVEHFDSDKVLTRLLQLIGA